MIYDRLAYPDYYSTKAIEPKLFRAILLFKTPNLLIQITLITIDLTVIRINLQEKNVFKTKHIFPRLKKTLSNL